MSTVALVVVLGFVLFVVLVVVLVVGWFSRSHSAGSVRPRPIRPLRSMAAWSGVHLLPIVEDDPWPTGPLPGPFTSGRWIAA